MTIDELMAVLQAAKEKKTIEQHIYGEDWRVFNLEAAVSRYARLRVKQEPREIWVTFTDSGEVYSARPYQHEIADPSFLRGPFLFREVIE